MSRVKGFNGVRYDKRLSERMVRGRLDIPLERLAYMPGKAHLYERTRTLLEVVSLLLEIPMAAAMDMAVAILIDKLNESLSAQGMPTIDREAWSTAHSRHFKEKKDETARPQTSAGSGGKPDRMAEPGGHGRPGRRRKGNPPDPGEPHPQDGGGRPGAGEPAKEYALKIALEMLTGTKVTAKETYNTLLSRAAAPLEQQLPGTMPSGAGNKPWRVYDDPFLRPPVDPVLAGQDGPIQFY